MSLPMIAISTMIQRMMRGILGYFSWQTSARCIPEKNAQHELKQEQTFDSGKSAISTMMTVKKLVFD